jgi:hypothetical protein
MHGFVGAQCPTEDLSHHQAMLRCRRLTIGEMAKLSRHRNNEVAAIEEASSFDFSNRLVGSDVAEVPHACGVSLAMAALDGGPAASVDGAVMIHAAAHRAVRHHVAEADPAQ